MFPVCFNYIKSVFVNLKNHIVDNLPAIIKALTAVWFFFQGIHTYIYAVLALTIGDVITGVIAAHKKGEAITSRKLRKGMLEKFGLYLILLMSIFTLDTVLKSIIPVNSFYLSAVVAFLISTYEVTSILENLVVIKPDMFFLRGLVKVFNKMQNNTIEQLEKKVETVADKITDLKLTEDGEPASGTTAPAATEDTPQTAPKQEIEG